MNGAPALQWVDSPFPLLQKRPPPPPNLLWRVRWSTGASDNKVREACMGRRKFWNWQASFLSTLGLRSALGTIESITVVWSTCHQFFLQTGKDQPQPQEPSCAATAKAASPVKMDWMKELRRNSGTTFSSIDNSSNLRQNDPVDEQVSASHRNHWNIGKNKGTLKQRVKHQFTRGQRESSGWPGDFWKITQT